MIRFVLVGVLLGLCVGCVQSVGDEPETPTQSISELSSRGTRLERVELAKLLRSLASRVDEFDGTTMLRDEMSKRMKARQRQAWAAWEDKIWQACLPGGKWSPEAARGALNEAAAGVEGVGP